MPVTRRSRKASPTPVDEKLTLNLGPVDLGQLDLLVAEGFYASRADFLRTAVRQQLARHETALQQAVARKTLVLGLRHLTVAELEAARAAGQPLHLRVLGLLVIDSEVTAELAAAAIASLEVLGSMQASPAVRAVLRDRTL